VGAEVAKPSDTGPTGRRIGAYRLVEKLASGGMAEIFLAHHEADAGFRKELVVKLLQGRYLDDATVRAMFIEEARLGAKLSHPSIVDVYDTGEEDGALFIAMEYIRGKTLTDLMLRGIEIGRPLPLPLAALIVSQVADGLEYLQSGVDSEGRPLEIVHRDISPTNLVVGVSGQTKIIDFGIARQGRAPAEEGGVRPGKLAYMSPEQVKGRPADARSDIFSLGTILYEITVGRRLWKGPQEIVMRRIVEESPPPPTFVVRDYPPALELVVQRALEKRPEARYGSAAEMCEDLEAYLAEEGSRVGQRQLARYLQELFAPGAQASDRGTRRARAYLDDDAEGGDELDFDRSGAVEAGAAFAKALRGSGPLKPASVSASPNELAGQGGGAGAGAPAGATQRGIDPAATAGEELPAAAPASAGARAASAGGAAAPSTEASRGASSELEDPRARVPPWAILLLVLLVFLATGLALTLWKT
jgi:tRNA A-37 threonylcarbamoyl transferase component Bud32